MKSIFLLFFLVLLGLFGFGQNQIDLKAKFDIENRSIEISQIITYKNTSKDTLSIIYLNDWNNSFASKKTALAERIADEYNNDFHLAKKEDRGYSEIKSIQQNNKDVVFSRLENQIDVIKVELNGPLLPQQAYTITLNYDVKIPVDRFTNYGYTANGDLNLRYWYITPAVYDGKWHYFSNKNLDDLFIPKSDVKLEITYPKDYYITSELDQIQLLENTSKEKIITLSGKERINNKLYITKKNDFKYVESHGFKIITDIEDRDLETIDKVLLIDRITEFIRKNFGDYPHDKLILSEIDASKDPVYGLNFLPSFIKPYPSHFQYELKLMKLALHNYLENTLFINPRTEQWLLDGIHMYYLMKYVDEQYPNMKFLGSIAGFWGVRSFHAADMTFNEKYNLAYMSMARTNRDQPLNLPKDSLLKFNKNIANKYKAGLGFKYLDDFVNSGIIEQTLSSFVQDYKLKPLKETDFENYLKSRTDKDINWFFTDYLQTRKKIDFRIKHVKKDDDSITLTIKNKRNNSMPISLYALNNDSVVSKYWIENIKERKTITIPRDSANKLVLNYENVIPEINLRDNWKSLKGFFFNNKPLQFRLFQDIEDPHYNQVFLMPIAEFNNIYDGITLGARIYNKALLRRRFNYKLTPKYSLNSKSLTGGVSASMTHYLENRNLFNVTYGIRTSYNSYAENLFVRQIIPSVSFAFREDDDFRSNKRQLVSLRYIDIKRDTDPNNILSTEDPSYSVFNARYINSNDNLINYNSWNVDFQLARQFSKLSFNYEFRKLFESNRQLNLRLYAGTFLNNKTDISSDYFSFALDRPTDYLFDYNYLGRSEASGLFSQQYIDAEGGFKSKLQTQFANQWITTLNASTTLWKYVLTYGDIGLIKNENDTAKFVYDSGIRINLVTDYFEVYFPIYSNLGWEIGQPNYDQKIRFKFTVDPQSLLGLFRRRWY